MPEYAFLQDLLVLLAVALASAFLFSRLRLSPIIGYLVTGILVGPYGFHLIRGEEQVEAMAEIGVILLLFTIGLEFSVSRILRLKGLMLRCGTVQVVLTGFLVFLSVRLLGESTGAALGLGMALALSSTAIVLKLLLERGEIDSAQGRIALSILIYQDLAVVFFIVALPLLGGGGEDLSPLILFKAAALMAGLFLFSRFGLPRLLKAILRARSPELFRLTILGVILGTAWITSQAGLSLALGAFLAGLALADSDYSHQVLADIIPFRDIFLALFFVSIGMLVDLRSLADQWPLVIGGFLGLSLLKIVTGTAAALWSRYPLRTAILAGLLLFQVGEFSFVLLKQALALQVMSESLYQVTLSVIALSMMVTPMIIARAPALAAGLARVLGRREEEWRTEAEERTANLAGHVIIAGYGLSGRSVGRVLREMHLPYVHVELNGETVRKAREAGEPIVYGDITSPTVLDGVGIGRARGLVLAINDPSALARAIRPAREINRDLYILVRTRFVLELDHLRGLGADEVIPDEVEASLQLSAFLLRRFAIEEGQILKLLAALRQEHYGRLRRPETPPTSLSGYLSVLEGGRIEFQAVPDNSPCLGQTLAELAIRTRTGATVVGVIRQERVLYGPAGEWRLEKGDTLLLLADPEKLALTRRLLHGQPL